MSRSITRGLHVTRTLRVYFARLIALELHGGDKMNIMSSRNVEVLTYCRLNFYTTKLHWEITTMAWVLLMQREARELTFRSSPFLPFTKTCFWPTGFIYATRSAPNLISGAFERKSLELFDILCACGSCVARGRRAFNVRRPQRRQRINHKTSEIITLMIMIRKYITCLR